MEKVILFCLMLGLYVTAFSQVIDTAFINKQVLLINSDQSLRIDTIDMEQTELSQGYDGGWEVLVFYKNNSVVKLVDIVGLSYGRISRTYYVQDGKPFFIDAFEEDFVVKANESTFDFEELRFAYSCRLFIDGSKELAISIGKPMIAWPCTQAHFTPAFDRLWKEVIVGR